MENFLIDIVLEWNYSTKPQKTTWPDIKLISILSSSNCLSLSYATVCKHHGSILGFCSPITKYNSYIHL